ncbi:MAG TPA: addiction module protein [Thermoanaerobaculia bacterium]|jgi:putative addiction module component (TIGR02574 family)|nr:addiction module protein [Thermoanaerobaculia bacterium]
MTKATEEVFQHAMALPLGERAELAAELLASFDGEPEPGVEAAWAAEIDRRVDRIRRGEAKGRPWEEVRADLERRGR